MVIDHLHTHRMANLYEKFAPEEARRINKKTKVTVYLTEEAEQALAELYIARYRKDRKVDCEAIQALFEKELN